MNVSNNVHMHYEEQRHDYEDDDDDHHDDDQASEGHINIKIPLRKPMASAIFGMTF